MKQETLDNGLIRITPSEGKRIMGKRTRRTYTEVECEPKNVNYFKEVDA